MVFLIVYNVYLMFCFQIKCMVIVRGLFGLYAVLLVGYHKRAITTSARFGHFKRAFLLQEANVLIGIVVTRI